MTTIPLGERTDILEKVVDFPSQVAKAYALTKSLSLSLPLVTEISSIVILGMGGSGIAGDFARVLLRDSKVPVHVCKSSVPPQFITNTTLVVAITYSGKTNETLDALNASLALGAKGIVITSSLELESTCNERQIPCILVPQNNYPRASLGYLLVPLLGLLQKFHILPSIERDVSETLSILEEIKSQCGPEAVYATNPARLLAIALEEKIPVVYGESNFTDVVALRWKQLFNENSKVHSYIDSFPELLHNEIEAWQKNAHTSHQHEVMIILRDTIHEHDTDMGEKIEAARDLIQSTGARVFEIWSKGKSELARLFSLSYMADFVTIYLALSMGTNPSRIPNIEQLKKKVLTSLQKQV
ncbi:MAG: glucose/mannose-6-phosphate isomerase [Candidatus Nitrosomirales archaeon]